MVTAKMQSDPPEPGPELAAILIARQRVPGADKGFLTNILRLTLAAHEAMAKPVQRRSVALDQPVM